MKNILIIFILLICSITYLIPNAQTIRFDKHYTLDKYGMGYHVNILRNDSGYLISGYQADSITPKALIIKTDINGDTIFCKKYFPFWSLFQGADTTVDGNYIFVGSIQTDTSINQYDYDFAITKVNPSGDMIWIKIINAPHDSAYIPKIIKTTHDNCYIIGGKQLPITNGYMSSFLMKTDSLGNIIWRKNYIIPNNNNAIWGGIVETADGSYICSGSDNGGTGNADIMIIKIDSLGNKKWIKFFGLNYYDDFGASIISLKNNNYLITGEWGGEPTDPCYKHLLLKINEYGDSLWLKHYGCYISGGTGSIIQSSDSNIVIVGASDFMGNGMDGIIMKVNQNGDSLWYRTYGTSQQNDWFFDVKETHDKGFIMSGETYSYNPGGSSVWLVKVDSLGLLVPLGINEEPLFPKAILGNAFPNPTNSNCTINFDIPEFKSAVSILLFNMQGKQLANYPLQKGENTMQLNLSKFAAGTYLYVLAIDNYNVKSGKIIKN